MAESHGVIPMPTDGRHLKKPGMGKTARQPKRLVQAPMASLAK
jgi:hypothetical protein